MIPDSNQAEKDSFDQLMQLSTSAEKAAAISRVNAEIDVTNRLGQITLPTLIMHSRDDQRVPMDQSQIMADKMPNARFVPLDSKNHLILEQDAGWPVFQQEVSKFLAAL
jgi:pimeloyl-ACP methyl ester carboxylesterase